MLRRTVIVLGLALLLCGTAVLAASPAHPVGSDGGREAPASGDPLVVPPGDWGAAPPVNPPALRSEPPAAAAPADPAPSRMPLVLALLAASLVVAFSRRGFDWPGSRPAPPPALPPAPPPPPVPPPAPRRVQLEVPLVFAPPQKPTVSTRKITVQVPQTVTRLQQVLRTRTVPVMRVVQRIEYVPVTETTYTTVTEPVYKTRRRWVPAYEIYRGKPRQVGGYLEDEEVQVGTRTRRVPQTVTRLVAKKITDRVPGVDTIIETVTVPVTTTEMVTREQTVTVEDPPDPVVIARHQAAVQGYQAAAARWWQALAAGDAAGVSAAAQQLRALSPQVGREFAADLQRRLEAQHAAAVQGLVQRQRARYWQSVAGGDEAGRQQAEQSLAAVHAALGSGILDGAGERVRAAVASAEAAAAAAGRPLARQAALDAVREQWRQVDAHNLAGARAAARKLAQIGQFDPSALAAAEQAERAPGRDLRAEAEAALLQAKQGWWQGLCEASDAAVAGSEVTASGWRDLCAARGVAVRQDWAAVDARGRQQVFAAVQAVFAQAAGRVRGEPARRWAYYQEHRGWWLAGHEAEFLAPLRERAVALGEQWWQTLTDGGMAVSDRAARLRELKAEESTLRALAGALGLGELPKADEAALRSRAVQYASDLVQRLAAAKSVAEADHLQKELDFLSEQGIKPASSAAQTGGDYLATIPQAPPNLKSIPELARYNFNQERLNEVWSYCLKNRVDPRLVLAIIPAEGTGSWDTSSDNKGADGGNGPNPNFSDDLRRAVSHILAKSHYYGDALRAGFAELARQHGLSTDGKNGPSYGNLIQMINWYQPMDIFSGASDPDSPSNSIPEGAYAQDANWCNNVAGIYKAMGGDVDALSAWAANAFKPQTPRTFKEQFVNDNVDRASGWTGSMNVYTDGKENFWKNPDDKKDAPEIQRHLKDGSWTLKYQRQALPAIVLVE